MVLEILEFQETWLLALIVGVLIFVIAYPFLSRPLGKGPGILTGIVLGIMGGYYFYINESFNSVAGNSLAVIIILVVLVIFIKIAWSFARHTKKRFS